MSYFKRDLYIDNMIENQLLDSLKIFIVIPSSLITIFVYLCCSALCFIMGYLINIYLDYLYILKNAFYHCKNISRKSRTSIIIRSPICLLDLTMIFQTIICQVFKNLHFLILINLTCQRSL